MPGPADRSFESHAEDFALWKAELAQNPPQEPFQETPPRPQVCEIPAQETDRRIREKTERFIGQVIASASFEVSHGTEGAIKSLADGIRQAKAGSPEGRKMVKMNVKTDVIERIIKAGFVMSVEMEVNAKGQVIQHGQTAEMIQANSLLYASQSPGMLVRTRAEVRNMFRIEDDIKHDRLDDAVFVTFSRPSETMSLEQMQDEGFFVDTMSVAIQATAMQGGKLITESAFVAGKKDKNSPRHDAETIVGLAAMLGVDLSGKSTAEIIDTPLRIPKWMMPNGVIDLVKLYDIAAGGTFFGQDKPPQDYLAYLEKCRQREAELDTMVEDIVNELISRAHLIRTPADATRMLAKFSGAHLLVRAVTDRQIDGAVFGPESERHLAESRYHYDRGEMDKANQQLELAIQKDDSRSCPGGRGNDPNNPNSPDSVGEDEFGSLTFTCPKGHANTRPRGKLIDNCRTCYISVACKPPKPQPPKPTVVALGGLAAKRQAAAAREQAQGTRGGRAGGPQSSRHSGRIAGRKPISTG